VRNTESMRGRSGFTLIDLLIIMAVVAVVVAALLLPSPTSSTPSHRSEARLTLKKIYLSEPAYRRHGMVNSYFRAGAAIDSPDRFAFDSAWMESFRKSPYVYNGAGLSESITADTWSIAEPDSPINTVNDVLN